MKLTYSLDEYVVQYRSRHIRSYTDLAGPLKSLAAAVEQRDMTAEDRPHLHLRIVKREIRDYELTQEEIEVAK